MKEGIGMYKCDLLALEDIKNNTICVKTELGIRSFKYEDDINRELVYVNNCVKKDSTIIKAGDMCRYIDILVIPKCDFNSIKI